MPSESQTTTDLPSIVYEAAQRERDLSAIRLSFQNNSNLMAVEIHRLRTALEDIAGAQMMWHGGVGRPPYDLVAGHIDCMKQMATEALNHAYP